MARVTHLRDKNGICDEGCFGCKLEGFYVAPSAMATRNPSAARAAVKDPQLEKDLAAYKRLRRNGEQPKHVVGASYFEKHANESVEITTGQIIADPADRKEFAERFALMPTETLVRTSPDDAPIHTKR